MAEEIEFRFPSSQPYAYVGVKGTAEELGKLDLEQLASLYANSLVGFKRYEQAAIEYMVSAPPALPMAPPVKGGEKAEAEYGEKMTSVIKDQLGATEIASASEAPYKQAAPAAQAKPWDKPKPKPTETVDVDGW